MESVATYSSAAEGEDDAGADVSCLMRVGRDSDWLRFYENSEVQYANANVASWRPLSVSISTWWLLKDLRGKRFIVHCRRGFPGKVLEECTLFLKKNE